MRKTRVIALCVPTLGLLHVNWVATWGSVMWPINVGKSQMFVVGKAVAEARNECVARALAMEDDATEVSHLFWIDDDVLVHPTAMLRLLQHRRPIASGVYFTRTEVSEPLILPGPGEGTQEFIPDRAFEVWGHGMGLTLVEMQVYRKMQEEMELGTDRYGLPQWYKTTGPAQAKLENGFVVGLETEDLYFLEKARGLGFSGFVDTSRHCFGWHHERKTDVGYPREQYEQMQGGQPVVWNTSEGQFTWPHPGE